MTEKARGGPGQVRVGKASESEPLSKCRKNMDNVRTEVVIKASG
ncbi:hypothetical protein FMEAI12_6060001 [Parafrankia sp. Ea1.12]|nr:hypothetical protein FMEAI12_6060001 [Parafrankia sp. Ea1.12]